MFLSIEFGSNIKIVEGYKKKDLLMISKAVTLNVPADIYNVNIVNIDLTAKSINEALSEKNINSKKVIFIINSDSVIIRKIKLPLLKKESETLSMILLELEQIISADLSQYKVIFKIIDTYNDDGVVSALYVAYCLPYNIYKQYRQLAAMLNLKLIGLDITSNCLNNLSMLSLNLNNNMANNEGVNAFVDIDLNAVTFCTLNKGINDFFRNSAVVNNIETAAEVQSPYMSCDSVSDGMIMLWLEEINKCIRYYFSIDNKKIDNIYIYGIKSNAWGLSRYLQLHLNIEVEIVNSIERVSFENKNALNEYFIPAIALANINSLNFLSKNKDYNMFLVIISITVIVVVFFCLYFFLFHNPESLQREIKTISLFINDEENVRNSMRIDKLKEETVLLENRIYNIEQAINSINNENVYSEILRNIYYSIPENTKILSFSANRSSVNMQCVSESINDVILLLSNLRNIYFVKRIHIPEVMSGQGAAYSFSVICELKDVHFIEE